VGAALCLPLAGCAVTTDDRDGSRRGTDRHSRTTTGRRDSTASATAGSTTTQPTGTDTDTDAGADVDVDTDVGGSTSTRTPTADLDLREANVTGVSVGRSGESFRFDVTLYHDDDGEDGYADWWQVETLAGERLGRRTLLHAHGTAPFTRTERIPVPDSVASVVVRGHDRTHGYGGQAMVVALDSGGTQAVRQGPEPRDLSGFEPRV
jgi:hypothetical protein